MQLYMMNGLYFGNPSFKVNPNISTSISNVCFHISKITSKSNPNVPPVPGTVIVILGLDEESEYLVYNREKKRQKETRLEELKRKKEAEKKVAKPKKTSKHKIPKKYKMRPKSEIVKKQQVKRAVIPKKKIPKKK